MIEIAVKKHLTKDCLVVLVAVRFDCTQRCNYTTSSIRPLPSSTNGVGTAYHCRLPYCTIIVVTAVHTTL